MLVDSSNLSPFSSAACFFSSLNSAFHCLPSAVKHNAMCLYHSHVWGYRWPAVCLCSSPLGQLEPSIISPRALLCPSAWADHQHNNTTRRDHLVFHSSRAHFLTSTNMNCYESILSLFADFLDKLCKSQLTFSCCRCLFQSCLFMDCFSVSLHSRSIHLSYDASDGHKLIHCWTHSTQHVHSQAFLRPHMGSIEAHYCTLGGVSSTMNSLAHF